MTGRYFLKTPRGYESSMMLAPPWQGARTQGSAKSTSFCSATRISIILATKKPLDWIRVHARSLDGFRRA
jgi:hypothetical protein